jgi:hypothetical protein
MVYRGDEASLALRCQALEERLDDLAKERQELEPQLRQWVKNAEQTEAMRRELDVLRQHVGAYSSARTLPLLQQVSVASPCQASWEDMPGEERVRFCVGCKKHVYNLSAMPRDEAEALLKEKGESLCVRFYRRTDGKILSGDCPVGVRSKRWRRRVALALGGSLFAAGAALSTAVRARDRTEGVVYSGRSLNRAYVHWTATPNPVAPNAIPPRVVGPPAQRIWAEMGGIGISPREEQLTLPARDRR